LPYFSSELGNYTCPLLIVVNGVVAQAVLATDALTRFGGTTTCHPLTSGGMLPVVVTVGQRYGLHQLSVDDDDCLNY